MKYNIISRFHAKIDEKNGTYYITDLNSTNGTYLNEVKLAALESKELHLEDKITFANISYRFESAS